MLKNSFPANEPTPFIVKPDTLEQRFPVKKKFERHFCKTIQSCQTRGAMYVTPG
jgi:hypothetical protein